MSLLAGEPRSATVRAVTDLTVLVIDHEAFKRNHQPPIRRCWGR